MMLKELAQAYLRNDAQGWFKFSQQLSQRIAEQILIETKIAAFKTRDIRLDLADEIMLELISPELVYIAATGDNEADTKHWIKQEVLNRLSDLTLDAPDTNRRYVAGQFGNELIPVAIPPWYEEFDDTFLSEDPRIMSVRRIFKPTLDGKIIDDIIEKVGIDLEAIDSEAEKTSSVLFRLDVIDRALYLSLLQHPDLLKKLNWRVFEKLLADILETFGYEIELQRGTKDGGIDIFAIRKDDSLGPHKYILQAKRWTNQVGIDPVRQLIFLHSYHRATKSCLATTASFTKGAIELAQQYRWQLELRDYLGIQEWIAKALRLR